MTLSEELFKKAEMISKSYWSSKEKKLKIQMLSYTNGITHSMDLNLRNKLSTLTKKN